MQMRTLFCDTYHNLQGFLLQKNQRHLISLRYETTIYYHILAETSAFIGANVVRKANLNINN